MSAVASPSPSELRPLLHQKLDAFTEAELAAVHQVLEQLERQWLFAEVAGDAEADRLSGLLDPALVEEAVRKHRSEKPYR